MTCVVIEEIGEADCEGDKKQCSSKKKVAPPPDGGWGWVVVLGSFFASMFSDGLIYSYGVFFPEFVKHYSISRSTVGWMGSLLIAVSMIIGPLVTYLCDRFSYRSVAVAGSIISAISFALPYFYSDLWFLIVTSSLFCGIGFGMVYLPSIMIVYSWFDKKRTLALGIAVAGSGLGTFVFSPLLEYLISRFDWQTTMLITGCIFLLLIPCCLTYAVPSLKKSEEEECEESEKKEEIVETILIEEVVVEKSDMEENKEEPIIDTFKIKMSMLEMMKNPIFILFIISNVLTNIGFNAPYMFAKDRAVTANISYAKGSFLISSIGIGNCIGRVLFGLISGMKCMNRLHLFNGALIVAGLILVLSWVITNYVLMVVFYVLFGLASGAFITLTSVILADIFGMQNLDIAFGLQLLFHGGSVLVGPPLAGLVYDVSKSFNLAFAACGIAIALSGALMYLGYISKRFRKVQFHD